MSIEFVIGSAIALVSFTTGVVAAFWFVRHETAKCTELLKRTSLLAANVSENLRITSGRHRLMKKTVKKQKAENLKLSQWCSNAVDLIKKQQQRINELENQ